MVRNNSMTCKSAPDLHLPSIGMITLDEIRNRAVIDEGSLLAWNNCPFEFYRSVTAPGIRYQRAAPPDTEFISAIAAGPCSSIEYRYGITAKKRTFGRFTPYHNPGYSCPVIDCNISYRGGRSLLCFERFPR